LNIYFDHKLDGLLIVLSLVISMAINYFLYFRNPENSSLTRLQKGFLASLRSIFLFLLFLLLIAPIIETHRILKQRPILAIAFDNSQSVSPYSASFEQFKQAAKNRLTGDYQLEFWNFGEEPEITEKLNVNDSRTDHSQIVKPAKNNPKNTQH